MKRRYVCIVLLSAVPTLAWGAPQEVSLPLDRYDELRSATRPSPEATPAPPVPFSLEAAELDVRAGKTSARLTQWLTLSIYDPDWQTIALSASGSFTAVDLGGLAGRVKADKDGLALVVRGVGRHRVRLESVVALAEDAATTRSARTLRLTLPSAAAINGVLSVPEDIENVDFVSGGLARGTGAAGRWGFVGTPGAGLEVRLLGKARVTERARLPLRFDASSTTLATLSRTRLRAKAVVTAQVRQGQLERLRLSVPKGFEVLSVSAGDAGWDMEDGGILVTPAVPVEAALSVAVDLSAEPQEQFAVPLLVPRGAASMRIVSGTRVEADGTSEVVDAGSARAIEDEELEGVPESLRPPGTQLFVVRDPEQPPKWSVTWAEGSKVLGAQVDRLVVDVVFGEAGRAAYQCWAVVRSTGATHLILKPPGEFQLVGAEREGAPVTPGVSEEGLVIPLEGGVEAQVIHIAGVLGGITVAQEGSFDILVPSASAPIGRAEVRAVLPGGRSYSLATPERSSRVSAVPVPRHPLVRKTPRSATTASLRRTPADLFAIPSGHVVLEAAWSALATTLGPLSIRVKPARSREKWF